jgi:hypothetical protein
MWPGLAITYCANARRDLIIDLRAHALKETQLDVFETFDNGGCFAQQFRRMRVGYRQAFHAGAAGTANAFSGTLKGRSSWKTCAAGYGIQWPGLDEDLSAEGLLRGAPSPAASARRPTNRPKRGRNMRRA